MGGGELCPGTDEESGRRMEAEEGTGFEGDQLKGEEIRSQWRAGVIFSESLSTLRSCQGSDETLNFFAKVQGKP
jgi:hypothetical protein